MRVMKDTTKTSKKGGREVGAALKVLFWIAVALLGVSAIGAIYMVGVIVAYCIG